jgi:hypothetical protein
MSRDIFRPTSLLKSTWSKDDFLKVSCLYHDLHFFSQFPAPLEVEVWCMESPIYDDLIIIKVSSARNPESPDPYWNFQVSAVQTRSNHVKRVMLSIVRCCKG